MKRFAMLGISLIITTMVLTSCSSKQVNETKLSFAEKASAAITKELKEEFAKESIVEVEGVVCSVEAEETGFEVGMEIKKLLKVKEEELQAKSLSPIVISICKYASSEVVPYVLKNSIEKKPCLRTLGAVNISRIGSTLCEKIDI